MAEAKKPAKKAKKSEKEVKEAELVVEAAPAELNEEELMAEERPAAAKAGKRSTKAVKATEEKQAKEARKASVDKEETAKPAAKPTRSRKERAGKKYRGVAKLIGKDKAYSLGEAILLATKTSPVKFDASVELHINLNVDPRQADQNVRDTVALPAGTGKDIRVETISDESTAAALFAKLDKEQIDFDVLIATPNLMPQLGKYARLLGPRGLMPSPKSGTVTTDVPAAVKQAKAGRVEYRVDPAGIIHLAIGKVSFGSEKLTQNAEAVLSSIRAAKPASVKGVYIKNMTLATTMGPGIKLETSARS